MSAYLFSMAVNDSRRMVDKDIRNRRAQITAANEKAARDLGISPNDAVLLQNIAAETLIASGVALR